jgi:ketosteroid isomerase-like protein
MSTENVKLVRRCLEAYSAGDNETALAAFDPDVEFDMTTRPDGGVFRGPEGIAEAMRTWTGTFESWRIEAEEMIDAGDHVFLVTREFGRGKGSGVEIEQVISQVMTFQNGKIVHWKTFLDRKNALEAAGLNE